MPTPRHQEGAPAAPPTAVRLCVHQEIRNKMRLRSDMPGGSCFSRRNRVRPPQPASNSTAARTTHACALLHAAGRACALCTAGIRTKAGRRWWRQASRPQCTPPLRGRRPAARLQLVESPVHLRMEDKGTGAQVGGGMHALHTGWVASTPSARSSSMPGWQQTATQRAAMNASVRDPREALKRHAACSRQQADRHRSGSPRTHRSGLPARF